MAVASLKEKEFKLPYGFFEDQTKYDLTEDITNSTKPKLFIFGKHDDLIPPETIKNTFKSFLEPKELHELDSDHDYRHHSHLIKQVNEIVGKFLEAYGRE